MDHVASARALELARDALSRDAALTEQAARELDDPLTHPRAVPPTPSRDLPPRIYPTMLSEFIRTLQAEYDQHGDMPVMARGIDNWRTSRVIAGREPYYWDGGGLHPAQDTPYACSQWVRSKHRPEYPHHLLIDAGNPEVALGTDPPETRDTIDGAPVEALPDD